MYWLLLEQVGTRSEGARSREFQLGGARTPTRGEASPRGAPANPRAAAPVVTVATTSCVAISSQRSGDEGLRPWPAGPRTLAPADPPRETGVAVAAARRPRPPPRALAGAPH